MIEEKSRQGGESDGSEPVEGVDVPRTPFFTDAPGAEPGDSVVEEALVAMVEELEREVPGDEGQAEGSDEPFDLEQEVLYLTDEVAHLKACIDHLLDLLEAQTQLADDVDLLFDRASVTERRVQRVEDVIGERDNGQRRRAEDVE